MNNPLSDDPDDALVPWPRGCTGWRVWEMLNDEAGVHEQDYIASFDRRNLLCARYWDAGLARLAAPRAVDKLRGRVVVVLGAQVWAALKVGPRPDPGRWRRGATDWAYLPHPSGRCRWYNDTANYQLAAEFLTRLYETRRAW